MSSDRIRIVENEVHAALKPLGYKKKARTWNRTAEPGVVHVIQMQLGRFDPPGTVEIPGVRENMHGRFTINVGVYVAEVEQHLSAFAANRSETIAEPRCCVRTRLAQIAGDPDTWWPSAATDASLSDIVTRLRRDALPFLDEVGTRDGVVRISASHTPEEHWGSRRPIIGAVILATRGDLDAARPLFEAANRYELERSSTQTTYARDLAARFGIQLDP